MTTSRTLESIQYDHLCRDFLDFLGHQTYLETLVFTAPTDSYISALTPGVPAVPHLGLLQNINAIGPFRKGTYWGAEHVARTETGVAIYPGLSNPVPAFISSISNLSSIRRLVLPADMIKITPTFIIALSRRVKTLEDIEWGFDYESQNHQAAFTHLLAQLPRLRKMTFLSLNQPLPLKDFDAPMFHEMVLVPLRQHVPASLKYVRYRHLCHQLIHGETQ